MYLIVLEHFKVYFKKYMKRPGRNIYLVRIAEMDYLSTMKTVLQRYNRAVPA